MKGLISFYSQNAFGESDIFVVFNTLDDVG